MSHRTTRRKFLTTTAAAGVGFWAAGGVAPRKSRAAIDEVIFGCIGVGGKGASDMADAGRLGVVAAICDIDEQSLDKAARRYSKAEKFFDWRVMYDKVGKSLDAVTISIPDHSHAVATSAALRMGIACYTQKPLTRTIYEARRLGELATEHKVATQMGNQYTAHTNLRYCAAAIPQGALGTIKEVHVWTNRPVWPQGLERPTETVDVPDYIHWDLFLGPAAERPYHPSYHPFKWRGWWDFGTGALGDMACHTFNMPFAALDLRNPTSVQAQTSGHNKETFPAWSIIDFEFPGNDRRPGIAVKWYDGKKVPPIELLGGHADAIAMFNDLQKKDQNSGVLLIGEKGRLYAAGDYAERAMFWIDCEEPKVDFNRSPGHFEEFINAIQGGEPAMSNFPDYASPLTETILLGNLAVWADGPKVEWDAEKLVATNHPELDSMIRPTYRSGYTL